MLAIQKQQDLLAKKTLSNTKFIEENIIPKLKDAIRKGEGQFSDFHLWAEFDPELRNKEPE